MKFVSFCLAGALALSPSVAGAHDLAVELAAAANSFLRSLPEGKSADVLFSFDSPIRKQWHFIPKQRKGLSIEQMTHAQRHLAMALLQTGLSHRGFDTSMKIMALEQVLFDLERGNRKRNPAAYHFFVFGQPDNDSSWAWRVEGHHLSISFTIVDGTTVVTTPAFFGANPATVPAHALEGLQALADEENLARGLVKQLSVEQKKTAVIPGEVPRDILMTPDRTAAPLTPAGLAAANMTKAQQGMLRSLIDAYLNKFRSSIAERDWRQIDEAGFEKIHFAWIGALQPGRPHYYRVQGPTFILEYDNIQSGANHVHTVWRDFLNDFGQDLLKRHYQEGHAAALNGG